MAGPMMLMPMSAAPMMPQMVAAPYQQQQQQPTLVYVFPVAQLPQSQQMQLPQPQQPQSQSQTSSEGSPDFVWPVPDDLLIGRSADDCSFMPNHDCENESNSDGQPNKLSASAARRRRRQRAAAYAKAEQLQRSIAEANGQEYIPPVHANKAHSTPVVGITSELCQQLKQKIEAGGEAQEQALNTLRGSVRAFSFDSNGCRVVQEAIEKAPPSEISELVQELKGSVRKAAASPYGNYVIQKAIEVLPHNATHFVVEELLNHASQTARHQYGCRIMCRLLEHSLSHPDTIRLFDQLLLNVGVLCRHEFAHYVMESILEHGTDSHKTLVGRSLEQELRYHSANRSMMYVLDAALRHCPQDMASRLLAAKQNYVASSYVPSYENMNCAFPGSQSGMTAMTMQPLCVY